jgi:hypothetical protein
MIVEVTTDGLDVREADDCTRLSVSTTLPDPQVDLALVRTGAGTRAADGPDVLLDVAMLHQRAKALASAADWETRWTAMIDYAAAKGWLTDDRSAVRAHIDRAG